ncbi:hypothetical protein FRB90_002434, partial [Tulasnella sp. 427]
ALIDACLPELAKNIAKGENFVKNSAFTNAVRFGEMPNKGDGVSINYDDPSAVSFPAFESSVVRETQATVGRPKMTEIFLPLVHFASKLWWEDLESVPEGRTSDSSAGAKSVDGEDYPPRSRSDTLSDMQPVDSFLSSSLTLGRARAGGSSSRYEPTTPPEAYSIVVDASCGSWNLDSQNQILRWSYPVPESPDRDVEYTIKIKRMGCAIPRVVNGTIGQDYSRRAETIRAVLRLFAPC